MKKARGSSHQVDSREYPQDLRKVGGNLQIDICLLDEKRSQRKFRIQRRNSYRGRVDNIAQHTPATLA